MAGRTLAQVEVVPEGMEFGVSRPGPGSGGDGEIKMEMKCAMLKCRRHSHSRPFALPWLGLTASARPARLSPLPLPSNKLLLASFAFGIS